MKSNRWSRRRRTSQDTRPDDGLAQIRRGFELKRSELFARLPYPTLATYLHAVAMWGKDSDAVLEAMGGFAGDTDVGGIRLVALRSGLVEHTGPLSARQARLTRRGLAVLTVLEGAPTSAAGALVGECSHG